MEKTGQDLEPKTPKQWEQKVAELVVRHGLSVRAAAQALEPPVSLTVEDADKLFKRKSFQRILWAERNRFYKELEADPNRNKSSAVGLLWLAAQRLAEESNWKDVADVVYKLARVEGWLEADQNVNVFGSLSAKDLAEIKERVKIAALSTKAN